MQPEERDIAIVDAGYGRRHHRAQAVAQGADIGVRVYLPTCPIHDPQGKPLDVVKHLARRGRTPLELLGTIEHGTSRIRVRVIALPVPLDKVAGAQRRLRKTARRKGRTASSTGLRRAAWSERSQELRAALVTAATPAPAPLPGQWPEQEAVGSSWRVQQLCLEMWRQQVWGEWTAQRQNECLSRRVRQMVTHPRQRGRDHQETVVRTRFSGQRLTRARPMAVME